MITINTLNNLGGFTIDVSKMPCPRSIVDQCKNHNIKRYVYCIRTNDDVIKYGLSYGTSRDKGERLYRQIAQMDGWGSNTIRGSSGSDFKYIMDTYFPGKTRFDVFIDIYDLTNFTYFGGNNDVEKAESILIDEYKKQHGRPPYGNRKDMSCNLKKALVPTSIYGKYFK